MRTIRYLFNTLIVGFWVVMMGLLVVREFLPATISPVEIRFPEKLPYIQDWAIYANTEKIGYSRIELQKSPQGEYLWKGITELQIPYTPFRCPPGRIGMGFEKEGIPISIKSSVLFGSDTRLKDFNIEMLLYGLAINIEGEVIDEELRLSCKTPDSDTEYTLPWSGNNDIINNGLLPWFYSPGLKVGDRFQWMVFNPLTQRKELVKAVVQRSSVYCQGGDFLKASVVEVWYQNAKMEFWIDEHGNLLKVHTPWGWDLIAE